MNLIQDSGTRTPLCPLNTNIPDDNSSPVTTKRQYAPQEEVTLPKQQNYTPSHPQSPPAYTDNLQDQSNESFFSNSLLMPVPQSAAYKRRVISPIRSESQNSIVDRRKDLNARKSLNSTEGILQVFQVVLVAIPRSMNILY